MTTGLELSRKMMPAIIKALGEIPSRHFIDIQTATAEKDLTCATDLILKIDSGDIAVRVRQFKCLYPPRFRDGILDFDFSVRWQTRNGNRTEIHKLRDGFARWYFFAIATQEEDELYDYFLADMDRVRQSGILDDEEQWQINPNGDGSAGGYLPAHELLNLGCITYHKNIK